MMPPAVIASDVAISTIVRLAVRTFGSRMIWTPFETASIPVYVPPPSEYARTKSMSAPIDAERRRWCAVEVRRWSRRDRADVADVAEDRDEQEHACVSDEDHEDGQDRRDRLLDAADVQDHEQARSPPISTAILMRCTGSSHVPMSAVEQVQRGLAEPRARDHAEDGVAAGRDRRR